MIDVYAVLSNLELAQVGAALLLIPLICWLNTHRSSFLCRWVVLLSGYVIQIGFYLILDDVGFRSNLLVLFATLAGCMWIYSTALLWPAKALIPVPANKENP
ncbi:hypothetical protein [Reinekea marinisedimentorum]|uniref:Inner membrane protein n=1 Tax=Reinekea marinisedimentorum TaxID=230495 RepID=A0A4R3I8G7_9GAMM|nr:hypothetical protein [Reinekea marinisedimentorum]TCS41589.1 hypothetical protein BCF53_10514 [Reinekea marinisedimentorum]